MTQTKDFDDSSSLASDDNYDILTDSTFSEDGDLVNLTPSESSAGQGHGEDVESIADGEITPEVISRPSTPGQGDNLKHSARTVIHDKEGADLPEALSQYEQDHREHQLPVVDSAGRYIRPGIHVDEKGRQHLRIIYNNFENQETLMRFREVDPSLQYRYQRSPQLRPNILELLKTKLASGSCSSIHNNISSRTTTGLLIEESVVLDIDRINNVDWSSNGAIDDVHLDSGVELHWNHDESTVTATDHWERPNLMVCTTDYEFTRLLHQKHSIPTLFICGFFNDPLPRNIPSYEAYISVEELKTISPKDLRNLINSVIRKPDLVDFGGYLVLKTADTLMQALGSFLASLRQSKHLFIDDSPAAQKCSAMYQEMGQYLSERRERGSVVRKELTSRCSQAWSQATARWRWSPPVMLLAIQLLLCIIHYFYNFYCFDQYMQEFTTTSTSINNAASEVVWITLTHAQSSETRAAPSVKPSSSKEIALSSALSSSRTISIPLPKPSRPPKDRYVNQPLPFVISDSTPETLTIRSDNHDVRYGAGKLRFVAYQDQQQIPIISEQDETWDGYQIRFMYPPVYGKINLGLIFGDDERATQWQQVTIEKPWLVETQEKMMTDLIDLSASMTTALGLASLSTRQILYQLRVAATGSALSLYNSTSYTVIEERLRREAERSSQETALLGKKVAEELASRGKDIEARFTEISDRISPVVCDLTKKSQKTVQEVVNYITDLSTRSGQKSVQKAQSRARGIWKKMKSKKRFGGTKVSHKIRAIKALSPKGRPTNSSKHRCKSRMKGADAKGARFRWSQWT